LNSYLLSFALFLAVSSGVLAEESLTTVKAPQVDFSWTGAHLGLSAGHAWASSDTRFSTKTHHSESDPRGYFGGAFAGYSFQFDNGIVLGAEADFDFASANDKNFVYVGTVPSYGDILTTSVDWTASLRARFGYAFDRMLIFGTVGVAAADFMVTEAYSGVHPVMIDETLSGWTAGVGVDYAVTDNLFARLEYRYSDFGSANSIKYPSWFTFESDLKSQDLRLGIAYKF
jgi:outer membrane immunogenic protein